MTEVDGREKPSADDTRALPASPLASNADEPTKDPAVPSEPVGTP
jgi:hypothetical protein